MNPLLLICGLVAAICGVVLLLDVRNVEAVIAIGLIASGLGLIVVAT